MSRRAVLVLAVAALALPVAGCGSGSGAGSSGAGIAPAGAPLYIALDTSFDSDNWDAAQDLLAKFPDGEHALGWLEVQLGAEGVDFERDVKPALGPETDVVALDLAGEGTFVGLTQSDDRAKLDGLLAEGDQPLSSREIDGWTAFAEDDAALDEFERMRAAGTLEASDDYETLHGEIDEGGLVRVFVARTAFASAQPPSFYKQLVGTESAALAASLTPEDDGIHLQGAVTPVSGDLFADEFEAELPGRVPGGAYLYAGANDLERPLGALRDMLAESAPDFERDLGRAEAELGVSLDEDVLPLFAGESAFYVRPGIPIPEITVVTEVDDEAGAVATVDKVAAAVEEYMPDARLGTTEAGGVQAKQLSLNPFVSVYYAAFDGELVLTTSPRGIADLRADDTRLADDERFSAALEAADMPAETTGFLYVNLADAIPAVLGLAGAGGAELPDMARSNLEPLQSLVLYGNTDGDLATFHGLLAVQ
jgi:uncharacterized protein DUF3352